MTHLLHLTAKAFLHLLLGGLLLFSIVLLLTFSPWLGTYRAFTVLSGSMEPEFSAGSVIFVRALPAYGVGDIVTRSAPSGRTTVTHRIVGTGERRGEAYFRTKGDANELADGEEVRPENILGKVFLDIPYLGYAVTFAKTPNGFLFLVLIPAILIILDESLGLWRAASELSLARHPERNIRRLVIV